MYLCICVGYYHAVTTISKPVNLCLSSGKSAGPNGQIIASVHKTRPIPRISAELLAIYRLPAHAIIKLELVHWILPPWICQYSPVKCGTTWITWQIAALTLGHDLVAYAPIMLVKCKHNTCECEQTGNGCEMHFVVSLSIQIQIRPIIHLFTEQ